MNTPIPSPSEEKVEQRGNRGMEQLRQELLSGQWDWSEVAEPAIAGVEGKTK